MKPTALPALLFAASFALVFTACSTAPPAGPRIDPALAGFIPSDTTLMAGTRLEALRRSPLYVKSMAHRSIPQVDRVTARTGIDPKDLWELLYVSNGKSEAVLGHGMFSDEGEPKLQQRNDNRFGYKGFNLVGNEISAVLLVSPTVLAMGDTDELRAMIDAHEKSAGPPPGMAALLARMGSSSQVWAAYGGGPIPSFSATGNMANINKILSLIQTGTLYLEISNDALGGVSGLAEGTSANDQSADQLESGLTGMISLGQLSTSAKQPQLSKVWNGLHPSRENREVRLRIDEPGDTVESLLDLLLGKTGSGK
jgi:hypothetical protein